MNKSMKKEQRQAVLRARVSSKDQEKEGFSIPAQLRLLREYASENGMTIVREFVDAETSKEAGRASFNEMIKFLKKHPSVRVLLVEKTDRLYRNIKDWVTIDDLGLEIHFVKENVILSPDSRSSEKFMHGIKVLMAKNYVDNLSEETKKGLLEKAEQAIYPSYAPLGYRNVVGANGKKIIEPDPDVASIIIKIFEWYATGNYTLEEVTQKATAAGLVSRGKKGAVSKSNIHKLLRKRIYTGDFDWNGKTYRGSHQPLITCELFEHVQQILDARFEGKHRKVIHDFAFSGLIRCGHCGCSLLSEIKKGRYVYYHCSGYKGKCPEPYTREEVLENCFSDILRDLVFDDDVMKWVTEALRQSHEDEKRFRDQSISRLQAEYTKLQNRLDKIYEDKVDGVISAEFFERKSREWFAEQSKLLRQIEEHQAANQTYITEGVRLLEVARRAYGLFQKQPPREKRRLLNFVVSNSSWKGGELTATFRQPFDMLAVANSAWKTKKAAGTGPDGLSEIWLRR